MNVFTAPWFYWSIIIAAGLPTVLVLLTELQHGLDRKGRFLARPVGLSLVALAAAHLLWGFPYPHQRTGIYIVPLLAWAVLAAARGRAARAAAGVLAALCVAQFALLARADHYGSWVDDAAMKRAIAQLRAREDGSRRVRVAARGGRKLTRGPCESQSARIALREGGLGGAAPLGLLAPATRGEVTACSTP